MSFVTFAQFVVSLLNMCSFLTDSELCLHGLTAVTTMCVRNRIVTVVSQTFVLSDEVL